MFYEKKKQFYFCVYYVSGNWFCNYLLHTRKSNGKWVQLKANRTYTAYDVTGDGTKDKIRIRASNQTDDEAYSSLTVSVNGKTAYRLKNTRFYNVIANIYTLKNGQPFYISMHQPRMVTDLYVHY